MRGARFSEGMGADCLLPKWKGLSALGVFILHPQGRASVSLAGSCGNGYSLRPQAVFVDNTNGGRHARPPIGCANGRGHWPKAFLMCVPKGGAACCRPFVA
jgi:hypothetical protein